MVGREEGWDLTASCMWEVPGMYKIQWFPFLLSTEKKNPWGSTGSDGPQQIFNGTGQSILKEGWDSKKRCKCGRC